MPEVEEPVRLFGLIPRGVCLTGNILERTLPNEAAPRYLAEKLAPAAFHDQTRKRKGRTEARPFRLFPELSSGSATQIDDGTPVLRLAHARSRRHERIVEALAFDGDC
jgi:hypothetical protein